MSSARTPSDEWILRLYVAGQSARSAAAALRNLEAICEEHLAGRYRIEVIDLLKHPQLARGDQIVAVPTLVRHLPPPMKKIIGDLSNEESVLVGLDYGRAAAARERRDQIPGSQEVLSWPPDEGEIPAAALRHGHDWQVGQGASECPPYLRRASERSMRPRGRGYLQESAAGPRRPDHRRARLIKRLPAPLRRLIGDMSDERRVLVGLDIRPRRGRVDG